MPGAQLLWNQAGADPICGLAQKFSPKRKFSALARSELQTLTALVLEAIALRHQIAVLGAQPNSSPVLSP
jgi:hypothetical protein